MKDSKSSAKVKSIVLIGCALGFLAVVFLPRDEGPKPEEAVSRTSATSTSPEVNSVRYERWKQRVKSASGASAEEYVANKVVQLGRSRREIVRAIGRRQKKEIPAEVESFFDALERGKWEEIDALFSGMAKRSAQYEGSTHSPELDPFWPAVLEAYGGAEQAHLWPAEKLLDYGDAILGALRPGMVYVGGTDPGRFIPTLLNASEAEPHIVITQNALADSRYQEYLRFQYGDQFELPTEADSTRIFEEYVSGAEKRLQHDEDFPEEPKQLRPGENVQLVKGKVAVSGQAAVMAINEKLLQTILQKNPEASFAMEESFPFSSTYADAAPLGPIMELRAAQLSFGEKEATETVKQWRETTQQLLNDPEGNSSPETLKTYSHLAVSRANLLAARNFPSEAEEAYRLAWKIFPDSTDAALGLAQFLSKIGRDDEARRTLDAFRSRVPLAE
ncbi:MAG TPA: tetratricopeptide repeat protein [Verrucomicrobiae bacterium]|nr:tetratricopeptide repeat protein [Verrucomicrobiae bacterium]